MDKLLHSGDIYFGINPNNKPIYEGEEETKEGEVNEEATTPRQTNTERTINRNVSFTSITANTSDLTPQSHTKTGLDTQMPPYPHLNFPTTQNNTTSTKPNPLSAQQQPLNPPNPQQQRPTPILGTKLLQFTLLYLYFTCLTPIFWL
jgi:hypothetical protein